MYLTGEVRAFLLASNSRFTLLRSWTSFSHPFLVEEDLLASHPPLTLHVCTSLMGPSSKWMAILR